MFPRGMCFSFLAFLFFATRDDDGTDAVSLTERFILYALTARPLVQTHTEFHRRTAHAILCNEMNDER